MLSQYKVLDKPEALFTAPPVCNLHTTKFSSQSTNAVEWYWDFNDGEGFSALENPKYDYLNPGVYQVALRVVSPQGCKDTLVQQVEVYALPTADFSVLNHCLNDELTPTDKSLGDVQEWNWKYGDGNTGTGSSPTHQYNKDGE